MAREEDALLRTVNTYGTDDTDDDDSPVTMDTPRVVVAPATAATGVGAAGDASLSVS